MTTRNRELASIIDAHEIPEGKEVGDVRVTAQIDPQGIDQSKLIPLMVKTIQEQQTTIDDLEAQLNATGSVADLEQRIHDIEQRLL